MVENEPANDDDITIETITATNTTNNTENTATTLVNDSSSDGGTNQWKEERWHQENDDTSKRSSDTSIISHNSSGSGVKASALICHDEIIVEINSKNESNENSDIDNGDLLLLDDEENDEGNIENKLLNINREVVIVKAQVENYSIYSGVGVNGYDEIGIKVQKKGW